MPDITFVLPTKNRPEKLKVTLDNLLLCSGDIKIIVIYVEEDQATQNILQQFPFVDAYAQEGTMTEALNAATKLVRSKYISWCWSDDLVFKDQFSIEAGINYLEDCNYENIVGVVYPYIWQGCEEPVTRFMRVPRTHQYSKLNENGQLRNYNVENTYYRQHGAVPFLNFGFIKTEIFNQVGGLDPAFSSYCNDDDFMMKLYTNNYKIHVMQQYTVLHDHINDETRKQNMKTLNKGVAVRNRKWGPLGFIECSIF